MTMKQEFRVIYKRQGGKRQYKTFQRYKNFYRYVRTLTAGSRDDLKPVIFLKTERRFVQDWQDYDMPNAGTPRV